MLHLQGSKRGNYSVQQLQQVHEWMIKQPTNEFIVVLVTGALESFVLSFPPKKGLTMIDVFGVAVLLSDVM